jgi:hypothetical protein
MSPVVKLNGSPVYGASSVFENGHKLREAIRAWINGLDPTPPQSALPQAEYASYTPVASGAATITPGEARLVTLKGTTAVTSVSGCDNLHAGKALTIACAPGETTKLKASGNLKIASAFACETNAQISFVCEPQMCSGGSNPGQICLVNGDCAGGGTCVAATWSETGRTSVTTRTATVNATAQTADIGATALFTAPAASGFVMRACGYIVEMVVGTTATMPKITISWTDADSSGAMTKDITATNSSAPATTIFDQGCVIANVKAGTALNYATSGYASTGTAMQFALHVRAEGL